MRFAAVDIGNTQTHIGILARKRPVRIRQVPTSRINTLPSIIRTVPVVAFSSVRPEASRKLRRALSGIQLFEMGVDFPPAIRVRTRHPYKVGMDRLAHAAAAWHRHHCACVVVALGTAIVFDVISRKGEFIGGLIAPGLGLSSWALNARCALLPTVTIVTPRRVIARDTRTNIQAGLYWSAAGLIEAGLREIRRELKERPRVIGTGGDASLFSEYFDEVLPHLALEGIAVSFHA